jgi:hypothetical protein
VSSIALTASIIFGLSLVGGIVGYRMARATWKRRADSWKRVADRLELQVEELSKRPTEADIDRLKAKCAFLGDENRRLKTENEKHRRLRRLELN